LPSPRHHLVTRIRPWGSKPASMPHPMRTRVRRAADRRRRFRLFDVPEAALRARDRRRHHGPSDGLDPLSERPRCGRDRGRRHGLPRSWSESTPMAREDGFSSSWGAPRGARTRGPAAGTTTPPPRRPTVLAIRAASGSTSLALGPNAKLRLIGKAQVELSRPASETRSQLS